MVTAQLKRRRLRKDNSGYDLRHSMIGSEGTLGIITGASLKPCRARGMGVALFTVSIQARFYPVGDDTHEVARLCQPLIDVENGVRFPVRNRWGTPSD